MNLSSIKSAVTISLVPEAKGGPFVLWDGLEEGMKTAATLGYDAVEIFAPGPDAVGVEEVMELIERYGVEISTLGTGAGWVLHGWSLTAAEEASRRHAIDFVKTIIERAAAFGASAIIGSMQGRSGNGVSRDQALDFLAIALEELGEFVQQHKQALIYEPLNRYETDLINSVRDGVALLNRMENKNLVLLADLFHMNIEEANVGDALREGGKHIGHVHFVDSNRNPAGCGHLDYGPVVEALSDIEFNGYAAAEARPWPTPQAAAASTIDSFKRLFR